MTVRTSASGALEGVRGFVVTISRWLAIIALAALFAVVASSVGARALFNLTSGRINLLVAGAIEMSAYLLLITVFAALPASLGAGMIRVDTFVGLFPRWLQKLLERIWSLLFVILAVLLVYLFWQQTATAAARGYTTQDLRIPLYFIYAIATLQCVGLSIVAICEFIRPTPPSTENA
ncbi:MAG: TRAP transporter small permease [Rhizobiaceae bacterium]